MQRLDEDKKGYITQSHFIKKFWAAYTYDDMFGAEDSISAARRSGSAAAGGPNTLGNRQLGISEKIKKSRMFSAI